MNFKWQIYIDIIYSIMFSWTAIIIRIFVSFSSEYYRNSMWFVGYIEAAKSYSCSTVRDLISAIRESMMTELLARNRLLHWCMAGVLSITGIVSYAPRQSLKTVILPICKHGNGNECCLTLFDFDCTVRYGTMQLTWLCTSWPRRFIARLQ